jgi:predicted kinase
MLNQPGKLVLIAGLPGSGKSWWMKANTPHTNFFVIDDFMAHAFGDISKFTYSRWYFPLVFALRAGRDAAISDIAFCDAENREEVERIMRDAVHELVCRWIFFEHAPEACRENIERDAREKGRSLDKRLQELEKWRCRYRIPSGSPVETVFRA